MSPELSADTGLDVLTHAFEAYVSNAQSAITDLLALEATRLITTYLPLSIQNPNDLEIRSKITSACMDVGLAFSNAGLGLVHAMAHSLGGYLDLFHGESNAILLSHVVPFNFLVAGERYRHLGLAMGLDVADKPLSQVETILVSEISRLAESLGIAPTLSGKGVQPSDIPELALRAIDDPDIATNPREPDLNEIEEIYERAL
jgi:alcohol dehydrogenase class IV